MNHLGLGSALLHSCWPRRAPPHYHSPHWLLILFMLNTVSPGTGAPSPMALLPPQQLVPSVSTSGPLGKPVWQISAFHMLFSLFLFFLSGAKPFKDLSCPLALHLGSSPVKSRLRNSKLAVSKLQSQPQNFDVVLCVCFQQHHPFCQLSLFFPPVRAVGGKGWGGKPHKTFMAAAAVTAEGGSGMYWKG